MYSKDTTKMLKKRNFISVGGFSNVDIVKKHLQKMDGSIQVILVDGMLMVLYLLLIVRRISSSYLKVNTLRMYFSYFFLTFFLFRS